MTIGDDRASLIAGIDQELSGLREMRGDLRTDYEAARTLADNYKTMLDHTDEQMDKTLALRHEIVSLPRD
jgi:hypothetical protein